MKYYNNYLFESKKDDIILIDTSLKNNKGLINIYEKYKNDYEKSKEYNDRYEILDYIFNISNRDNKENNKKNEEKIQNINNSWKQIEKMISSKKIKKLKLDIKIKLFEYIAHTDKNIILKIFSKEIYEFLMNERNLYLHQNNKNNELTEILQYYQQYYPKSKKEDIILINQILNNNNEKNEHYEKYLNDLEEAKKMNLIAPFIKKYLNIKKLKEEEITETDIDNAKNNWIIIENFIKKGKLNSKVRKDIKNFLFDIFQNKDNKDRLIKIFNKEIYDNFIIKNNVKIIDNNDNNNDNDNENNENNNYYKEKIQEKEKEKEKENDINTISSKTKQSSNSYENCSIIPANDDANINQNLPNIQSLQNNNLNCNSVSTKNPTSQQKKETIIKVKIPTEYIASEEYDYLVEIMLTKSVFILHTNKNKKILYDEMNFGKANIKLNFEQLKEIKKFCADNESEKDLFKKFNKYVEFLDIIKKRLENEFELKYKLRMKLEIAKYDEIEIDRDILFCKYIFYLPDSNNEKLFKEDNILKYKTNSPSQGFNYMISEINDESYKNIEYIENIQKEEKNKEEEIKEEYLALKIIQFEKIIGNHKGSKNHYTAEFIKELSNGYFISSGTDNVLYIYTPDFELNKQLNQIKIINDWTYSIIQRSHSIKKTDIIELLTCSNKEVYLFIVDLLNGNIKTTRYEFPEITCVNCIEMEPNHFAMIGLNGGLYFLDLLNEDKEVQNLTISKKTLRGGIRINDNLIALTSNKIGLNGEDKLIFFNSQIKENNQISHEISGYSFTFNTNGLALMPRENVDVKNKILICACTKYLPDQKNGILLVNPQLEDKKDVQEPFYDTGDFEVFCICPIFEIVDEERIDTEFFLVGGFDNEKYIGSIKLYKVIYSSKAFNIKIEYLQDIEFEKNDEFEGFEGAVSCIIQSTYTGNILATCYDGNIYKLSKPNLSFYMNQ